MFSSKVIAAHVRSCCACVSMWSVLYIFLHRVAHVTLSVQISTTLSDVPALSHTHAHTPHTHTQSDKRARRRQKNGDGPLPQSCCRRLCCRRFKSDDISPRVRR